QFAEDVADSPPLQMLPPIFFARRWTLIVAVLYLLVISRVVDRTVRRSLPSLERVMRIDAATFRGFARRLEHPGIAVNVALLAVSALIVIALFPLLGLSLVTDDPVTHLQVYLPSSAGDALLVLAGYTVIGWAVLSLVYLTVRLARALGELTRQPLDVDVFDTANLFPFGNIALAGALAPAGIIVILLLGLGEPSTWLSWTVLLLAAVSSLLVLLLPLRGIHRQMSEAKEAVLADLSARIGQVYEDVSRASIDSPQQPGLAERTGTLIPLRKTVEEMTTWPFADTVAFGRAVLIASAPLIYTVLSELIRIFWIDPLSH
ncbi:MAG: hypothetical protein QOJ75_2436, partial [Chloroflexota bacterium]|nr:hypothetical protein [Chloroflexota bacterium]